MTDAVYWCSDSSYLYGWTGNIMHLFIYISFWNVQVLLHTLDLFSFCSKKKNRCIYACWILYVQDLQTLEHDTIPVEWTLIVSNALSIQ